MDEDEQVYLKKKVHLLNQRIRELKFVLGSTDIIRALETLSNDILILANPGFDELGVQLLMGYKKSSKEVKKE